MKDAHYTPLIGAKPSITRFRDSNFDDDKTVKLERPEHREAEGVGGLDHRSARIR